MKRLAIQLAHEYKYEPDFTNMNPTVVKIYKAMKEYKSYTRADIAKLCKIPRPTANARVSDMIMKHLVVESAVEWDEKNKRPIQRVRKI